MERLDYDRARSIFNNYVANTRLNIPDNLSPEELEKRIKMIDYVHSSTYTCIDAGDKILSSLFASDSIRDFAKIAILNHDIGRFEQIRLYGSLDDKLLRRETIYKHHGYLGDIILGDLMKRESSDSYIYMPIRRITRNHVSSDIDDSSIDIFSDRIVMASSIDKLLIGNDKQGVFVDGVTLLVRDIENLGLYPRMFNDNNGRKGYVLEDRGNDNYFRALNKIKSFTLI